MAYKISIDARHVKEAGKPGRYVTVMHEPREFPDGTYSIETKYWPAPDTQRTPLSIIMTRVWSSDLLDPNAQYKFVRALGAFAMKPSSDVLAEHRAAVQEFVRGDHTNFLGMHEDLIDMLPAEVARALPDAADGRDGSGYDGWMRKEDRPKIR